MAPNKRSRIKMKMDIPMNSLSSFKAVARTPKHTLQMASFDLDIPKKMYMHD